MVVVRDIVDNIADTRLARFVVHNHIQSHPQYMEGVQERCAVSFSFVHNTANSALSDEDAALLRRPPGVRLPVIFVYSLLIGLRRLFQLSS